MSEKRSTFSGSIGFVLAAAGSAVGLGNIWRFPYLAAKHGGLFLVVYIILAITFGFALLTAEIAIGRKTRQSPLTAYGALKKNWRGLGFISCLIPFLIITYYGIIGGWVLKYMVAFIIGQGAEAAGDSYFTGFITSYAQPIVFTAIFLGLTAFFVSRGVNQGIEKISTILMPILIVLVVGISIFAITMSHTTDDGTVRTGLDGLKIYVRPNFTGVTLNQFLIVLMDATGQLFYSLSVAMGIMIAYGSYLKKEDNMVKSINQIEIFDTGVAILAGLMIIPTVFIFMGQEGLDNAGPGLMFVAMPKVFQQMGGIGNVIGALFFIMVAFAALTSCISILEAVVSSIIDLTKISRAKATWLSFPVIMIMSVIICLGYNVFYFEVGLPNGATAQILDIVDYLSNNILMPVIAILTCILIGWVLKPQVIIDEVTRNGEHFRREKLFVFMIKFAAPILLVILLMKGLGILNL